MFGFLRAKEEWEVVVVNSFDDLFVGMAGDDWVRGVPVGETGKAKIFGNGSMVVTLDNVKDTPYTKPLKVYTKKGEPRFNDFRLVKQIR